MSEEQKGRFAAFTPFRFIAGKIRNKVLAILLVATLGTIIVALVAVVTSRITSQSITQLVDRDGRIVALSNEAIQELMRARELDQNYLLNYKQLGFQNARVLYVGEVESHVQRVNDLLDEIEQIESDEQGSIEQLDLLRAELDDYRTSFLGMVASAEAKGHKDEGAEGRLRDIIHRVEEAAKTLGDETLLVSILTVRRNEKDYLLRNERRYIQQTRESVQDLKEKILRRVGDEQLKMSLFFLSDQYLDIFNQMVVVDNMIRGYGRDYRSAINKMIPTITTLIEAQQKGQADTIAELKNLDRLSFIIVVIVALLTIMLGVFGAIFFSRRLTKQIDNIMEMFGDIGIGDFSARAKVVTDDELGEMAESLNAMLDNTLVLIQSREERDAIQGSIMKLLAEISDLADGDLTVRAEVTEEVTGAIADSFNNMAEQLSRVVKGVKTASSLVGSSSTDVNQVTKKLSQSSEEQAARIRAAITIIERIAESIRNVASSADESARVSGSARESARAGSDAVLKTNQAMGLIKENMRGTARTVKRLGESSQEIGNIVQIINDIADRTSILALNASIQAAMAGEEGRGFAVVAEEVQRLAERSATSTKQIETLINTIQGEISEASISMEKSIQQVVDGTELADEAYGKLEEIETVSNQLAELVESISESSRRQAAESENITKLMNEVGQLTEETTAATRETTTSMEKITTTSRQLEESIAVFKIEDEAVSA
ncbi:methyl-accepting chemotaxis protein [Desulfofustis glycolicus]|uniref:Twitching motility protein PilJ n=1 Tax=Desulfofustis glycolicus DSM 9705 TaxID=1121409 RepID=A0A1M5VH77_9BACT|nr:methyl-accepting chemotaxis protein [Desulfofustis glycolicus]MCB2217583.1 HAMP domain-containing protein [Desulfobulbaceae bacterium]SHH74587.1 twitching motility protein PilJ [Desulfofustis glycolicus DSM 9705]